MFPAGSGVGVRVGGEGREFEEVFSLKFIVLALQGPPRGAGGLIGGGEGLS